MITLNLSEDQAEMLTQICECREAEARAFGMSVAYAQLMYQLQGEDYFITLVERAATPKQLDIARDQYKEIVTSRKKDDEFFSKLIQRKDSFTRPAWGGE